MDKYFMHRIKVEDGSITKGIEVHDSLTSAVRAFHSNMKQGFGNPDFPKLTFIACWVETPQGGILPQYNSRWLRDPASDGNLIFFHHIRKDGESFDKNIDVYPTMADAEHRFHAEMEYGYDNPKFPNVGFESCMITEKLSGQILMSETWIRPAQQPEPEPAPEPSSEA